MMICTNNLWHDTYLTVGYDVALSYERTNIDVEYVYSMNIRTVGVSNYYIRVKIKPRNGINRIMPNLVGSTWYSWNNNVGVSVLKT